MAKTCTHVLPVEDCATCQAYDGLGAPDLSQKRHFCFECDCALVGPLCPSCNLITSADTRKFELRLAFGLGIAFGVALSVFVAVYLPI